MVTDTGRLIPGTTNEDWQLYFNVLRNKIIPSSNKRMQLFSSYSLSYGIHGYGAKYHGNTNYESYCKFINGVLKAIRSGELDFCYYVYQVQDLLRYEHEHLQCIYLESEDCFLVYLDTRNKTQNLVDDYLAGGVNETEILS